MRRFFYSVTLFSCALGLATSNELPAEDSPVPIVPGQAQFAALKELSPFSRSLNLADSLVLTGAAQADGILFVTLIDTETKESYVVSGDEPNLQGWKMVDLKQDPDIEKVIAKISIPGGEVVTIKHQADAIAAAGDTRPAGAPERAEGRGDGGKGDGRGKDGKRRGGPPPEIREKFSKLSDEQRQQAFEQIRKLRENNAEMSEEQRHKAVGAILDKVAKGE
ncbi:MAG: hypothetical protein AAF226_01440 [Verrucomicrobiota bacterium]